VPQVPQATCRAVSTAWRHVARFLKHCMPSDARLGRSATHLLHSEGRRPAAGFGRLPSCSALEVPAPTTPCSVTCEQLSGNELRLVVGGCPPLHYMALPPPSNRITTSHTCTIHLMCPTPTPVALSGESIHSPVGPLSFFLRP
jgi:hypothetical protein